MDEPTNVHRASVYRMYPTAAQAQRLSSWAGAVRFVYNLALEQRKMFWRQGRRFDFVTQGRELSALRREAEWLADVPRDCLDQALRDLDQAHRNWWDGRASAPRFRRAGVNDSFRFPKPADFRLERSSRRMGWLKAPKIGRLRIRLDRTGGEPKSVTVFRRAGLWFAAVLCERPCNAHVDAAERPIGIDRGVTVFAALSDGRLISPVNAMGAARRQLASALRNLQRKVKGSQNYRKQRLRVARLHLRVANTRKDFLHKVSTDIAKSHGVVVIEKLRVQNMTRSAAGTTEKPGQNVRAKSGLNRSILDQGWGMFRTMLAYKLTERGGQLIEVPANDTSRTCAECGVVDGASRTAQRFVCTGCGHEAHADTNAAINILRRGSPSMPVEGSRASGPDEAGTVRRSA